MEHTTPVRETNSPKHRPAEKPHRTRRTVDKSAQAALRSSLRAQFWAGPPEAEFDRPTVGALLDVGAKSMELRASRGDTPPYVIRGKRAWYKKADVLAWLEKSGHTVRSTAERAAKVAEAA